MIWLSKLWSCYLNFEFSCSWSVFLLHELWACYLNNDIVILLPKLWSWYIVSDIVTWAVNLLLELWYCYLTSEFDTRTTNNHISAHSPRELVLEYANDLPYKLIFCIHKLDDFPLLKKEWKQAIIRNHSHLYWVCPEQTETNDTKV